MCAWRELSHFAGFDWAKDHHDVVVVDKSGCIVADFRFENTAEGWQDYSKQMKAFPTVAIVIETSQGVTVERLLALGATVFPVNPKNAERYRERKTSAGVKSDRMDAWSLADALRVDGHTWRPLATEDPLIVELRQLCRDEVALTTQRTRLVNQLQQALHEYYPVALEAFDDWTMPSAWAFILQFPTPQDLAKAGKRAWNKFLHAHRLARPEMYEKRMECFERATAFCGTTATTSAKSRLAVTLAKMLQPLEHGLSEYRDRIRELFEKHPDHDLFGSLPGSGDKTAPRLLAELGDDRTRFSSAGDLQSYAGTAPVGWQSGKKNFAKFRYACNKHLRYALHWLADNSRHRCAWAQVYYDKKCKEGKRHATALRCLANRWLDILWKMWQTRSEYDPELHQRNQLKHGSWIMKLLPQGATSP